MNYFTHYQRITIDHNALLAISVCSNHEYKVNITVAAEIGSSLLFTVKVDYQCQPFTEFVFFLSHFCLVT